MSESKFGKVKALVRKVGWRCIFSAYNQMTAAIEKADNNPNCPGQVPCPITSQGTTKFRLFPDWELTGEGFHNDHGRMDGYRLIAEFEQSMPRALDAIISIAGGDLTQISSVEVAAAQVKPERRVMDVEKGKKLLKMLQRTVNESIPARESSEVANYLRARGLKGDVSELPDCLLFHPHLYHKSESGDVSYHPGLLGVFTDLNQGWITLHRHYLNAGGLGKAKVDEKKKLMPSPYSISGHAIRLDPPCYFGDEGLIAVCEGLETALAVREATGLPVWSCYCSDVMAQIEIPETINNVVIWADKDVSGAGERLANDLAARLRLSGKHVRIYVPEEAIPEGKKSIDWLDVYARYGAQRFPVYCETPYRVQTGVEIAV